jgi:hypothetical protein
VVQELTLQGRQLDDGTASSGEGGPRRPCA